MSRDDILDHLRLANRRARMRLRSSDLDVGAVEDDTSEVGLFTGVDVWLDDLWSLTFREIREGARVTFDGMEKLRTFLVVFHFDMVDGIGTAPFEFGRDGGVLLSLRVESRVECAPDVALETVRLPLRRAGVRAISASCAVDEDDVRVMWSVEAALEDHDRIAGSLREWVQVVRANLNRNPRVVQRHDRIRTAGAAWKGR